MIRSPPMHAGLVKLGNTSDPWHTQDHLAELSEIAGQNKNSFDYLKDPREIQDTCVSMEKSQSRVGIFAPFLSVKTSTVSETWQIMSCIDLRYVCFAIVLWNVAFCSSGCIYGFRTLGIGVDVFFISGAVMNPWPPM